MNIFIFFKSNRFTKVLFKAKLETMYNIKIKLFKFLKMCAKFRTTLHPSSTIHTLITLLYNDY